jgi:curved DNA-binding protein CbpA
VKNYYELLELTSSASHDDIKKAFRLQIARYHPDKVHHLGKEFQEIAATRAAELTEAYRILSNQKLRADYDAQRQSAPAGSPAQGPPTPAAHAAAPPPSTQPEWSAPKDDPAPPRGSPFTQERASRDAFVRKAIVERFRHALSQVVGDKYDESQARGFDTAWTPKSGFFGRGKGPRLLGRFVDTLDGASVAESWARAAKLDLPKGEDLCVILMGVHLAPSRELAQAIAEQRRRPTTRSGKVTLIPVDARVWDAHMPTDAPDVAKNLLNRLRSGG